MNTLQVHAVSYHQTMIKIIVKMALVQIRTQPIIEGYSHTAKQTLQSQAGI